MLLQRGHGAQTHWLRIATVPLANPEINLDVFSIDRADSGVWHIARCEYPNRHWNSDNVWIFLRRKLAPNS